MAWNTLHGHFFHSSLQNINYLGDHFSPIHFVLSPMYFLWENAATLLILQSVGIGLASIALYLLTLEKLAQKWLAPVMAILFLFNPYLHRISTFDFHPIALAIPIFLWMLYCLEKVDAHCHYICASLLLRLRKHFSLPSLEWEFT